MSRILSVGLVGCGGQTRRNLAPAVARIASARLVSCADVDADRARQVADEFQVEKVYGGAEELLAGGGVDAIIVSVPHRYLKPVTLSAIGAGKHVFIEKPMGLNAAEGAEVVEAARQQGVVAMVGYCMRYSLSRMFIKSLLDRGRWETSALWWPVRGAAPWGDGSRDPTRKGEANSSFWGLT